MIERTAFHRWRASVHGCLGGGNSCASPNPPWILMHLAMGWRPGTPLLGHQWGNVAEGRAI